MALADEDIQFIKDHLAEWLAEQSLGKPPAVYEIELRERMVRVEEDLKRQRDRIEGLSVQMDSRFDQLEQRFEQRFEQMDRRFEQVDKRFEQVDKRFEQMDKRFEQVDKRLDDQAKRMDRFMVWTFSTVMVAAGLVIAAVKLFPP